MAVLATPGAANTCTPEWGYQPRTYRLHKYPAESHFRLALLPGLCVCICIEKSCECPRAPVVPVSIPPPLRARSLRPKLSLYVKVPLNQAAESGTENRDRANEVGSGCCLCRLLRCDPKASGLGICQAGINRTLSRFVQVYSGTPVGSALFC